LAILAKNLSFILAIVAKSYKQFIDYGDFMQIGNEKTLDICFGTK